MAIEPIETRLARLEEAMVSVKGDTTYLRKTLDEFQQKYWRHLLEQATKLAGMSATISLVVGVTTVAMSHSIFR